MNENNGNSASAGLQFDEEMCEQYIFGELSPADQERFEETYFSDDVFFERYLAVKTELLDLLGRDELSAEKRSRMEPHFQATAPRRRRIEDSALFTTSLTAVAQRRTKTKAPLFAPPVKSDGLFEGLIRSITAFFRSPKLAALAVLLLAVAGGLYFLNRSSSIDDEKDVAFIVENDPPTREQIVTSSPEALAREDVPVSEPEPDVTLPDRSNDNTTSESDSYRPAWRSQKTPSIIVPKRPPSRSPSTSKRDSTGFALTLSAVDRDTGRDVGPAPTKGLNISGKRDKQRSPGEGLTQSIVLRPGATRDGGETNTLILRSGNDRDWASITLLFKGDLYPDYVVTITNMAGKVVLKDTDLRVERRPDGSNALSVWIDETTAFKEAEKDFIVTLQGSTRAGVLETIEEYYFHIRRVSPKPAPNDSQLLAAELSGTVVGPNGEPVAKATVTVRNITTGMIRNIMSLDDGSYRMVQLPPGDYEVYAEASSLKRTPIKELKLTSSPVELPIYMESGGSDSIVNVEKLTTINPRPSITLAPMFSPGSVGVKKLELRGDSQVADIQLVTPVTRHSSFNVTIRRVDGKTVYSRNLSKNRVVKGIITLPVRSKLLRPGDHVVHLRGRSARGRSEPIAEFYFHVEKPD